MTKKDELKQDLNVVLNSLEAYKQNIEQLESEQRLFSIEATQREYNVYFLDVCKREVKMLERKKRQLEYKINKPFDELEMYNLFDDSWDAIVNGKERIPLPRPL
ncbi:hypothetical protein A6284_28315 [Bacillus wiedmannii]|nr:hypothetical protein A6284_28315 [Bacillus wiedmannii]